jgi:RNA polymerase sigma-70 factor (ECF subfamily)
MEKAHKNSDSRDFVSLLIPNQRKIQAYIITLVPNINDAEDVYQETVSEMWNKFSTFKPGTDFIAWAITTARFKVLAFRSKHRNSKVQFNSNTYEFLEPAAASQLPVIQDHLDVLGMCLRKLSDNEKSLLKMRYENDLTFQKIASRVGKTAPALHRQMSIIHSRLAICIRHILRQEGIA